MPTPRDGYFALDGKKVPGTTTIIGRFKESSGLMQWAFQQGKAGLPHLYAEAEKAADIGTVAHAMVEMHVNNRTVDEAFIFAKDSLPDEAMADKACSAFNAYLSWERNFNVKILYQERQLVSEQYRYGGTPDVIGMIGGEVVLLDWKTSNAVYPDYLIQLAAYKHLWEENEPAVPITGGFHLLRFAKTHGDFAHHFYPNLDEAWRAFVLMRELYDIDKQLKKRAA